MIGQFFVEITKGNTEIKICLRDLRKTFIQIVSTHSIFMVIFLFNSCCFLSTIYLAAFLLISFFIRFQHKLLSVKLYILTWIKLCFSFFYFVLIMSSYKKSCDFLLVIISISVDLGHSFFAVIILQVDTT